MVKLWLSLSVWCSEFKDVHFKCFILKLENVLIPQSFKAFSPGSPSGRCLYPEPLTVWGHAAPMILIAFLFTLKLCHRNWRKVIPILHNEVICKFQGSIILLFQSLAMIKFKFYVTQNLIDVLYIWSTDVTHCMASSLSRGCSIMLTVVNIHGCFAGEFGERVWGHQL